MEDRALYDFPALPTKVRKEVRKLARHGRFHDAPAVAKLAYEWAQAFLETSGERVKASEVIEAAVDFVTSMAPDTAILERRLAITLVEMGRPG